MQSQVEICTDRSTEHCHVYSLHNACAAFTF